MGQCQLQKTRFTGHILLFSTQNQNPNTKVLDEVDPELLKHLKSLGISIDEQKKLSGVAVDIVMDSVSVATTFKKTLAEKGIIFCSISEAIKEHPELVKKYIGSVIPPKDNYYAALNSAVFTDGSFVIFQKEFVVRWNYQPILESIKQERDSLNEL